MASAEVPRSPRRPSHYVCPSCRLHLLSWDPPTRSVDIFHRVGLWEDCWSREVRLICQTCLGATDVVPDGLVELLRARFGLLPASRGARRAR